MKLFYSILVSFFSILGYSQTILHQPESTTRTVQDPQMVLLTPGFNATSGVSNPFVAKIGPGTENPGGGPTDSQAGANNPSGTTAPLGQSFHDTNGNIDVNGAGQLQFTLPISLPPGVKNVAPQVNLTYISGSGNGAAGYGWTLSGITAISRTSKIIDKDNEVKSMQLDYSDYYSFNGQRLILKSGEYGKDGAEYVTEKYSNVKIKSIGAAQSAASGPMYFHVTFEDGSQAWYGDLQSDDPEHNSRNGRSSLEYNIVKWRDTQGNYINYFYDYTTGQMQGGVCRISYIEWGGNESLSKPHFNRIDFNYIERNLTEDSYVGGFRYVQNKLLKDITVKSNGAQFKKYVIEYFNNGTNYQLINKITERNSEDDPANPITFTYPTPTIQSLIYSAAPNNINTFENVRLSGDFNGDSNLDFVMNDGVIKLSALNSSFSTTSTGKAFSSEAKAVNTLLDEEGQIFNGNGIIDYENDKIVGYIFRDNSFVKVFEKTVPKPCTSCTPQVKLNVGDVNGDGISDVFVILTNGGFQERLVVDLKNSANPTSTLSYGNYLDSSYINQSYLDVDGDGKVDVIDVSNSVYTVFEFVKTSPTQYEKRIKFSNSLVEGKDSDIPVVYGDYNGDGNLDFAIPTTSSKTMDDWRFYIGTEKGFSNFLKTNFSRFRKPTGTYPLVDRYFYSSSDINKDGKSDLVYVYSYNKIGPVNQNGNASYRTVGYDIFTYTSSGAQLDGSLNFSTSGNLGSTHNVSNGEYAIFVPITSQMKVSNNYYDVFLFWKERLHKLKAPSSISMLSQIQSITQGGITTTAYYKELNNNVDSNFYRKTKKEFYPYFSLEKVDQSFAVFQLTQVGLKKDFRYRGMTGSLHGKGVMGFYQTARSSWYADGFENTKIWNGGEIDPLQDGLPVKEWSIRTNIESNIFPADISENNSQLLSLKSTIYQTDKLLNGQIVTTVADVDKPKIVFAIVPKTIKTKDFLTGNHNINSIVYGNYYLPLQNLSVLNNNYATTTSNFEYTHNLSGVGSDYFIGRPKSKTDVVTAYGDTKSHKEEYTYESNLLKTHKTWNRDNSGYQQQVYVYDGYGNVIQKIVNNSLDQESVINKDEYDSTGRFVLKSIDNLNLETNFSYNNWGQRLTITDPLGNILTNTYDAWGKVLKSKSNLGGTTTYKYERDSNSNIIATQYDPDGNISTNYTNIRGQKYKATVKSFNQGEFISSETQYDLLGRKVGESEPYVEGQSPYQWNVINYDDSVYPSKITVTSFTGKQIETSISGLTTTIKELNGYVRTTSKTTDAIGNIISSNDKGGTIVFTYNAAGEQIKAQYAENIVTTKYDAWGRKSEFNDPSNGVYKYEYNGLAKPKKIISPKGTKAFTYNTLGQLILQEEISTNDGGQTTDKKISYTYDDKGRLVLKSGTSNGKAYSSSTSYDPQGRVLSNSENNNGKYYIKKGLTYDDKGRIISYEKSLYSSGVLTKVNIFNEYSTWNGEMYIIKDQNTGRVLWALQQTDNRGQILSAALGRTRIRNSYDGNGMLSGIDHQYRFQLEGTPSLLQVFYNIDAVKNELTSRITTGDFNITETFEYDDNNRLIKWTDPRTGLYSENSYDVKGRITENDQVGIIKYENPAKTYQPTGMTLNALGTQNYNNDLIQHIVYNENNDPVFIDGEKGDVAFQYGLTSMRQRITYGGNFNPDGDGKFTKFYSEDGDFEIIKDNTTGKEKHVIYIGETPYESNIIYLKNYDDISGSYKFLHKDYIGSILAISDEAGNRLEQRHFDAWGNFTHLQIGNGSIITDKNTIDNSMLLLDRGYTSHEYFAEVGIIHMNGRLYDPLLRRFLNADENIQDSFNTQFYNKYGYVLNNPLMYNDPSGEFAFLLPVMFWLATNAAAVAVVTTGALIGAAIGAVMYVGQAIYANHWSWGGFGKAILTGGVTGAVSAGAGQIFSAAGFWATVANGAIAGAGSGGVSALINGTNFLEGITKGAIIGGAIAGVTYTLSYLTTKPTRSYMEASERNTLSAGTPVGDRVYARDLYDSQLEKHSGLSTENIYNRANPGGTMNKSTGLIHYKDGEKTVKALGVTETKPDFISGKVKSKMYLSNKAFSSREQLAYVMQHEINHVGVHWSPLLKEALKPIEFVKGSPGAAESRLDNVGHYYIYESGNNFLQNNGWLNKVLHVAEEVYHSNSYRNFNEAVKKLMKGEGKININFK